MKKIRFVPSDCAYILISKCCRIRGDAGNALKAVPAAPLVINILTPLSVYPKCSVMVEKNFCASLGTIEALFKHTCYSLLYFCTLLTASFVAMSDTRSRTCTQSAMLSYHTNSAAS
jgi:hypothetical protein